MQTNLVVQGLELMLVGMATVFVFLVLLVVATTMMSSLVQRLQPALAEDAVSEEEIAAITIAVARHRGDA